MTTPTHNNIERASINYFCNFEILDLIIKELNQKAKQEPDKDMQQILQDSPARQTYKRMIKYKCREFYPAIKIEYRAENETNKKYKTTPKKVWLHLNKQGCVDALSKPSKTENNKQLNTNKMQNFKYLETDLKKHFESGKTDTFSDIKKENEKEKQVLADKLKTDINTTIEKVINN